MDVLMIMLLVMGTLQIVSGIAMKTKNFSSSLIFKVFPLFSGIVMDIVAVAHFGWIQIVG